MHLADERGLAAGRDCFVPIVSDLESKWIVDATQSASVPLVPLHGLAAARRCYVGLALESRVAVRALRRRYLRISRECERSVAIKQCAATIGLDDNCRIR